MSKPPSTIDSVENFLEILQPSTMADHAHSKLPYTPLVAKKLGQDPELTELACKYLDDTGDDSLRAYIPSLGLHLKSNMSAAIDILENTNKIEIFDSILEHAGEFYTAQEAHGLEESAEFCRSPQPDPARAGYTKLSMPILIAKLVVQVVGRRQQNHSDEFRVKAREVSHFKVVIFLVLEAQFLHGVCSELLHVESIKCDGGIWEALKYNLVHSFREVHCNLTHLESQIPMNPHKCSDHILNLRSAYDGNQSSLASMGILV